MRQWLITGIPGTGKTSVGDYLAAEHDFEQPPTLMRFLGRGEQGLRSELDALAAKGRDVVVSWGFMPREQLPVVLFLRDVGFEWIWFDGNREAARRTFLDRGTVPEHLLDAQLMRIARHIDLDRLQPRLLNSFDDRGEFRPLAEIAAELGSRR